MPYRTVSARAAVFMRHRGVRGYHVYKDDEVEQGPRCYSFTLDPYGSESDEHSSDVRELSTWQEPPHPPYLTGDNDTPTNRSAWDRWHNEGVETKAVKTAIRAALDSGELRLPEEREQDT